jgi:putative metallohydrolase (TIGR04338 family)
MQKAKAYRSENAIRDSHSKRLTWAECCDFAEKIRTSAYVIRKYGNRSLRVEKGRSGGQAYPNGKVSLGVWARTDLIIVHEAAHVYNRTGQSHGWQWAGIFVDLTRHFIGKEAAEALKAEFRKNHVRFTEPRTRKPLSPEQRAANIERLAAARAAKAPAVPKSEEPKPLSHSQESRLLDLYTMVKSRESRGGEGLMRVRGHSNHQLCTWKALERRGLVTLELLPDYKRTYYARITDEGRKALSRWDREDNNIKESVSA